jgi:hypothetical protein
VTTQNWTGEIHFFFFRVESRVKIFSFGGGGEQTVLEQKELKGYHLSSVVKNFVLLSAAVVRSGVNCARLLD